MFSHVTIRFPTEYQITSSSSSLLAFDPCTVLGVCLYGAEQVWSRASRLTTVLLVSPVPTVLHAVTVKSTRQTLGEIPTRKISFWAQRSDCTAFSQCIIYVKKGTGILSNGKKLLIWPNSFHIILFNFRKAL